MCCVHCIVLVCVFSIFGVCAFNVDVEFPLILNGSQGDYFGYTVALHRNRNGPIALVGAPKANSSYFNILHEPGALYQCGIKTLSCKEINLDKTGNTLSANRIYHDRKDNMWLGVSLDTRENALQNDIVTCGHLWKNQLYVLHYLVNGVCYVINGDLDENRVEKLVPFAGTPKQSLSNIYYYAFGQVGTSAAFTKDGKNLLLGAPGFYNWIGTVVNYGLDPKSKYQSYTSPNVPNPDPKQNISAETYIGYSVTSGKFFEDDEEYAAVGAPRDGKLQGRVYIYNARRQADTLPVYRRKEGKQLGEYFGASVLGVNLNDDLYTDLLVGAPLHSAESVDEGKVYVFISNGNGLQEYAELQGRKKPHSRFGTAIAAAGDLNQDGYEDVIVGAPYEDIYGVIYIYHGASKGIIEQFSQRISASEISQKISGFGIHISRGLDIDNNEYPDLLVGSYSSSKAVILRTKPVVQLFANLAFSPDQINTNVTNCEYSGNNISCINITACLWFTGKHVPFHMDIKHSIFVEHSSTLSLVQPRGFFFNENKTTFIEQSSTLTIGLKSCIHNILYIEPEIKDVISPLQILYKYFMIPPKSTISAFNESFPIVSPSTSSNITSVISFQTGCGNADKCLSDLHISAKIIGMPEKYIVIGEISSLVITVEVQNFGEPAYLSELYIYLPSELPNINQDICSTIKDTNNKNVTLLCEVGNPLFKNRKASLSIKLDLLKVPTNIKELEIILEARSVSTEIKPSDNILKIPLNFKAVADISITGTPSHEQIPFDENTDKREFVHLTHTYFIMNHGPSRVQVIDIKLLVPMSFQDQDHSVDFLSFSSIETDSGKDLTIPAHCNDSHLNLQSRVSPAKHDVNNINELHKFYNSTQTEFNDYGLKNPTLDLLSNTRPNPDKRNDQKQLRRKMDMKINCETAKCIEIVCSAGEFSDSRKFAKIDISMLLNLSAININIDPWYRIEFSTFGEVHIRDDGSGIQYKHQRVDNKQVTTIIVSSGPLASEEIAQWIIIVSVLVGILLLVIILIVLVKFGFFKREQKEKMENLKKRSSMTNYEPCEHENTESETFS